MSRKMTEDELLHTQRNATIKASQKRSRATLQAEQKASDAFPGEWDEPQREYEVYKSQSAMYASRRQLKPLPDNRLAVECPCGKGIAMLKEGKFVVYLKPKGHDARMGVRVPPTFYRVHIVSCLPHTEPGTRNGLFQDIFIAGVCPQCNQQHRIRVCEIENWFHQCGIQPQKNANWWDEHIAFKIGKEEITEKLPRHL